MEEEEAKKEKEKKKEGVGEEKRGRVTNRDGGWVRGNTLKDWTRRALTYSTNIHHHNNIHTYFKHERRPLPTAKEGGEHATDVWYDEHRQYLFFLPPFLLTELKNGFIRRQCEWIAIRTAVW
jgi:hypothetical protein